MIDADDVDPMPENENLFDGDPIPLTQSGQIPRFPVDMLPTPIANMVCAVSEATQTDPPMAATSALSVLSACTGGRAEIQIRSGWREPLNTYAATIAYPGERKSAVQRSMVRPLLDVERQLTEEGRDARLEAETRKQVATKAAERRRQAAATAMADGQPGDSMADAIAATRAADAIEVPPAPRLVADDITPEAACSLLADQGGRLAIISAEGGIFGIIAGRYNNDKVNMDLWLKGHSGDELRVDRKGRPPEYVPRPALTVGLMIQPLVLSTIAANREFRGRGLLARFLYSCPAQMVGRRRIGVPVTADIEEAYTAAVSALAKGMAERDGCPAVLTLTESARTALERIEAEVEPTLAGDGELAGLADWGAKYVGAIARIAGNFHLAEHGPVEGLRKEVTEKTIQAATRVGAYFKACAIDAFAEMGADHITADAVYLLERIVRLGQDEVSERDLFTMGSRARFRKKADLMPVLERLVDHGYLAPMSARPSGGRPPSPRYKVHPHAAKAAKQAKGAGVEAECAPSAASAASAACPQPDADPRPDETARVPRGGKPTEPTGAHWRKSPSRAKTTYDPTETISKPESAGSQSAQSGQVGSSNFVGPAGEPTACAAEPRAFETPDPPERQRHEDQDDPRPPTLPESGRAEVGDFDTPRNKLLDKLNAAGPQTTNGNGERRAPVLATDTKPVPPGGLTSSTRGQTDRMKRAMARALATTPSSATDGQHTGADLTVERDLDGPKQQG